MKLLDRKITTKISDMISDIVSTCNRILSTDAKVDENASYDSKDDAKNRLKLVLMHDRSQLTPLQMEQMREEMIDVISRYVDIDRDALDLCLESETNTLALVANIPISRVRKEEESNELRAEALIKAETAAAEAEEFQEVEAETQEAQAETAEVQTEEVEAEIQEVQAETEEVQSEVQEADQPKDQEQN